MPAEGTVMGRLVDAWHRLQSDVPLRCVDTAFVCSVPEWLVDAAAPDPCASAVAR